MLVAGFNVPDKCPENCPNIDSFSLYGQSSICGRCPVFCCAEDNDGFALVSAAEYRPDWAEEWEGWFNSGMKDSAFPTLPLAAEKKIQ